MSSEASTSGVSNVVGRLQHLRLSQEDVDDPQQNANIAVAGDSSPEPVRNSHTIGNVTFSRVRRALNFVCDEDQSTSSRSAESSFSNADK